MFSLSLPRHRPVKHEAIPLLPNSDNNVEEDDSEYLPIFTASNNTMSSQASRLTIYLALLCMFTAVLSTIIALTAAAQHRSSVVNLSLYDLQSPLRTDLRGLRRPSQFMGLEKINRTGLQPPHELSIFNFPFVVARVDELDPKSIITMGPNSHIVVKGIDIRKVEVTDCISTVIQFRILDWQLESCRLHIYVPQYSSVATGSGESFIDIYRLTSTSVLEIDKLSRSTQPAIEEKLATVNLSSEHGVDWNYPFQCAMDSLHTFSLVAGSKSTSAQWWQDKQLNNPAIYITQHEY
ncbi:hypothetical protein BT96DRAFT_1025284 [Gymnopus androsaceus JB14]|uniref:Ubiquitin 3 binding protein But2 C-terminal domain-containing protein n=1 Tax=Gymnopus androsaceus JB14 TaxID=1447944 RepID=A0A6A4GSR0_9AGAR|nr:hypothetical protein BT96DRAFT_1025284 [Gymnopus androsaceus JB14]